MTYQYVICETPIVMESAVWLLGATAQSDNTIHVQIWHGLMRLVNQIFRKPDPIFVAWVAPLPDVKANWMPIIKAAVTSQALIRFTFRFIWPRRKTSVSLKLNL